MTEKDEHKAQKPPPDDSTQEDNSPPVISQLLEELGEQIGRGWQSPLTSAELLSETRR